MVDLPALNLSLTVCQQGCRHLLTQFAVTAAGVIYLLLHEAFSVPPRSPWDVLNNYG